MGEDSDPSAPPPSGHSDLQHYGPSDTLAPSSSPPPLRPTPPATGPPHSLGLDSDFAAQPRAHPPRRRPAGGGAPWAAESSPFVPGWVPPVGRLATVDARRHPRGSPPPRSPRLVLILARRAPPAAPSPERSFPGASGVRSDSVIGRADATYLAFSCIRCLACLGTSRSSVLRRLPDLGGPSSGYRLSWSLGDRYL